MDDFGPITEAISLQSMLLATGCRSFVPYEQQKVFFDLGAKYNTRTLSGANRVGKTAAFYRGELAFHLTGEYPDWWEGRVFDKPVTAWIGSTDWATNVAGCQKALVGDIATGQMGKGEIDPITNKIIPCGLPLDTIERVDPNNQVKNALYGVLVKHKSGGHSYVRFIAYSKGREKLQAGKVDIVGFDEEPPEDIYSELVLRTMDSGGMQVLTFTPLKGMTEIVRQQIGDVKVDKDFPSVITNKTGALVRISMYDAPHLSDEMIEELRGKIPEHQHLSRIEGIPALGAGAIYTVADAKLKIPAFRDKQVPPHWLVCDGMDIGINHPTARARVYYDPDAEVFILSQVYKQADLATKVHAANWRESFYGNVPVVWPHDARNRQEGLDGDALESVADKYRRHGVNMTDGPVTMADGSRLSSEGAIQEMDELMRTGKFKVMDHPQTADFFLEKALYRREKTSSGMLKIHGVFDDALHAVRNAVLGLQSGEGAVVAGAFNRYERKYTKEEAYQMGNALPHDEDDDTEYAAR